MVMKQCRVKKWNRSEMLSDELIAATVGDVDWLRLSLNKAKGKVAVDRNGYNAMHYAAQNGRLECLRVLVEEYNMDVNLPDLRGYRPIHMILNKECQFCAESCLKYLLDIGADPNVQTIDGQSPLHQAAEVGLLDCITTLVDAGANVKAKDGKGQIPFDLAKLWGHRTCARYLASLVWKSNGRDFLKEMQKLQRLKLVLLSDEQRLHNIQQEKRDRLTKDQYTLWLERKHLPDTVRISPSLYRPRTTLAEETLRQLREAVSTAEAMGTMKVLQLAKPRSACQPRAAGKEGRAAARNAACGVPAKGRAAVCWPGTAPGPGHKLASSPTLADEDVFDLRTLVQQHDFGPFYELEVNRAHLPQLRAKADPRVTKPLPNLPLHILRRELFPGSVPHRIKIPEEFKAVHVFDIPRKKPSGKNRDMQLGEWLELGLPSLSFTTTECSRKSAWFLGTASSPRGEETKEILEEGSPESRADSPQEHCEP
ncbi:ankyrin repeat domain-containing protein 53 [Hypanus sabinus]|uniref:ankyrin repeat domain-containing protein 53 n=1 Tax=Hypanus sabinus TaxID=79690 RepID=UPI0028C46C14|nr:ankyrin repeat domain-containing protein 53 [Hypanus sabinus]XP_059821839.1 ankyrin repeat domain-containing protein 53 [Hypanus sabinus]